MLDVRGNHETKMCVDNYGGRLDYQQENRQLPLEATELQGVWKLVYGNVINHTFIWEYHESTI